MNSQDIKDWFRQNVSRETFAALEIYEKTLVQWQASINLVSNTTLSNIWLRHFMDSYQLAGVIGQNVSRETIHLADLGSGAGFPGMILAILGFNQVILLESDQRKSAFLREISRITGVKPNIANQRIETFSEHQDIITCRAFADITKILEISKNMRHAETVYYLLKPLDMDLELTNATKYWYFNHYIVPSVMDPRGCILKLSDVKAK